MTDRREELPKHSAYGPSSLEYREECPSFESSKFDNPNALEGTLLHEACETDDLELCDTREQAEAVQMCLEYTNGLVAAYDPATVEVFREKRIDIYKKVTYGTVDFLATDRVHADVADYKFGRLPVTPAKENIQLGAYALGVSLEFNVKTVTVHIICPRQGFVSTHTYDEAGLEEVRQRIISIVERCEDPNKKELPHGSACHRCGRKLECKALGEVIMQTSTDVVKHMTGLQLPSTFDINRLATPDDRAKLQVIVAIMEDWCSMVKKVNTKAAVEDGVIIPGYSVRSRSGAASISDTASAAIEVSKQYNIPLEQILQACKMSLPSLTDLVQAHVETHTTDKPTKKATREALELALTDHISIGRASTYIQKDRGIDHEKILIG